MVGLDTVTRMGIDRTTLYVSVRGGRAAGKGEGVVMSTRKWAARLALLILVISFVGAVASGCKSSGKSGGSSCGDPGCQTKH